MHKITIITKERKKERKKEHEVGLFTGFVCVCNYFTYYKSSNGRTLPS